MDRPPSLPAELATCHALLREHAQTIESHAQTIAWQGQTIDAQAHTIESHALSIEELQRQKQALAQEHQELQLAFAELLQRAFQRRSERYLEDPNQLRIDFGDSDEAADAAAGLAQAVEESQSQTVLEQTIREHTRRVRLRPRHEKLPEHLPRLEVEAPVPEEVRHCPQHGARKLIGYDVVETLHFERPKLWVRQTKYPKYACQNQPDCGVASPERAAGLVEGNRYDTSLAAEVITGKYAYHLPIYREQDYFAGCGWTPSRSTLLNLLEASAGVTRPLMDYFKQSVLASGVLGTDDTRTTLLVPKSIPPPLAGDLKSQRIHEVFQEALREKKPSVSARMWAYRSLTVPLNVFDFTVSRHRDGPETFLRNFRGTLLADCYSGYQGIALRSAGAIQRAACAAHARRKVFEARDVYPREASLLLGMFQQLYDIEDRGKTLSAEERRRLRQREAAPVWQAMRQWLEGEAAAAVLPKSKLAEALSYLRNHAGPLRVYLEDGRLPIDNNDVEQLMKQVAIGRKNWLFVGSVAAGERAADFLTLVSSAVRNDLDVWAYIKDVLDQLLDGSTDYESLRPDVWRQTHPEFIRQYRVAERRDRADRKQRRRSDRRQRTG
ncbi:MAG: IS66 family transposase [Acidobacteria bacterium]|nr:IS66 family transposase [Acidobacteriota bacterium]